MRYLLTLITVLAISGCASIGSIIPSFWDPNQSARITDVRFGIERLDCQSDQIQLQVSKLRDDLLWFELYSESKGSRQQDVIKIVLPIRETVEDMWKRYQSGQATKSYCEIKQRILRSQAQRAAEAVQGRF